MSEILKEWNINISGEFQNLRQNEWYKNALKNISRPENQNVLKEFFSSNLNPWRADIIGNTRNWLDTLKYSLN